MKRFVFILLTYLAVNVGAGALASEAGCSQTFYKTKDLSCVGIFLDALSRDQRQINPNAVGFFSALFKRSPSMTDDLLKRAKSPIEKATLIEALYRSGKLAEAKRYARANSLTEFLKAIQSAKTSGIDDTKPYADPAGNDRMVGAYMATGDPAYILRILDNTKNVEEGLLHDVFRVALFTDKFGRGLGPKKRGEKGIGALCGKYDCKENQESFMRVLTLSFGVWSVMSLSKRDEGIKEVFASFLKSHGDHKSIFSFERANFSNYLTLLILDQTNVEDEAVEHFLVTYETFGSAEEVRQAYRGIVAKNGN